MNCNHLRLISAVSLLLAISPVTTTAQVVQAPPHVPQASARTERPSSTADVIKITGCLRLEKDVPGLKPSVAERAGLNDDYMLINVLPSQDSNVSGIGLGPMYEIEGIEKSQLKEHVNQEVEVEGSIGKPDHEGGSPDFNATSLKVLSATCIAK